MENEIIVNEETLQIGRETRTRHQLSSFGGFLGTDDRADLMLSVSALRERNGAIERSK